MVKRYTTNIGKSFQKKNNMDIKVTFKQFSHIYHSYSCPNEYIKKIEKGEEYHPHSWYNYPEEDFVRKIFFGCYQHKCVAKETLWRSDSQNYFRNIEDVIKDWNDSIRYDEKTDSWYNRPVMEIHFVDGERRKFYFDTDEELDRKLKEITEEEISTLNI